jgi:3-dehydrotetronate 4-kinase
MSIKLGCIADDFTGATDLANNLVRAGMRCVQYIGVPDSALVPDADAVVIALKSRTVAPMVAIEESERALDWLRLHGAEQIYFKYCSTFDSTDKGNIGPVAQALLAKLGSNFTVATPAFPDNQRTVFKGYLFVGDQLLSESGMRHHPLTPMTDANLVRVLQQQTTHKVGLLDYKTIGTTSEKIKAQIEVLRAQGIGMAIVDAVNNDDLMRIGPALKGMPLVTGGSGLAIGLPQNWGIAPSQGSAALPKASGLSAVVSGSCSQATNAQVDYFKAQGLPAYALDAASIASAQLSAQQAATQALAWAKANLTPSIPVLIYSTAQPEQVQKVQASVGSEAAGARVEQTLARIAKGLVEQGVGKLVVAGGETSGACVQALGITHMQIGAQIDPGVPWCFAHSNTRTLHLALKSGNFGTQDFFTKALAQC